MYLMASLQEPCFVGRHMTYVLLVTIPQIILYVIGLPVIGTIHLLRNKDKLHDSQFSTRYGLLYLGYQDNRAWWELVVAFRKVLVVSTGTFGTLLGVVDIQAHLALLVVFVSIVVHLVGQPFDMTRENTKLLHNLELAALAICWMTFWGGLLFFLGHEKENSVSPGVKTGMTIGLVGTNVLFLVASTFIFFKEFKKDIKMKRRRKTALANGGQRIDLTRIVPIRGDDHEGKDDVCFIPEASPFVDAALVAHADALHDNHVMHEKGFQQNTEKRQKRAKRKTAMRLQARLKLKDSKALHQLPSFSLLKEEEINAIIDEMDHLVRFKGDLICRQHDASDSFYIIVQGEASVTVDVAGEGDEAEEEGTFHAQQVEVAKLNTLQFFGESALLVDEEALCNATVTVSSEKCDLLRLKKNNFVKLMTVHAQTFLRHNNGKSIIEQMKDTKLKRASSNKMVLDRRRSSRQGAVKGGHEVAKKVVALARPKGLPMLPVAAGGSKATNDRSLFS